MQNLAPEIGAINQQFQAPLTEAKLSGRTSGLLPDLEAQKQGAISGLIFGERPQAADKLSSLASDLLGKAGATNQGVAGELIDYNAVIRGLQQRAQLAGAEQWSQLGSGLADILSKVLKPGGGGPMSEQPNFPLPSIFTPPPLPSGPGLP
jgi:hypothetical protein